MALVIPLLAHGQDLITVGSVHAPSGGSVSLPVSVRDSSGTPLGAGLGAGSRIQAVALKVVTSPPGAVTQIQFERAGVLQPLNPLYERGGEAGGTYAYVASFAAATNPIPFAINLAKPGDRIGTLRLQLAAGLSPGTPVAVTLEPSFTILSNQAGTITESQYNRKLRLVHGVVTIGGTQTATTLTSSLNPSNLGDAVTFTATVSPVPPGGSVAFRRGSKVFGIVPVTQGVATLTTNALQVGSSSITAQYEGSGTYQGSLSQVLVQTVNANPVAAPHTLVAVAKSPTTVELGWISVPNAVSYEIWRSTGGAFALVGSSGTAAFNDNGLTPGTTYLYQVRAVATGGGKSEPSPTDAATTIMFTDDPLVSGIRVKTVHIGELRMAVNAYRAAAGLLPAAFTDPALSGGMPIRRVHVEELRSAVKAARAAFGLPLLSFDDPALTGAKVRARHLNELRLAVK